MTEEEFEEVQSVANILRGMNFDQRIPKEVRDILMESSDRLEEVLQHYV